MLQIFFVNLYKEYTSLKSRELEELLRFRVMSWQPFNLPWSASLCCSGNSYGCKNTKILLEKKFLFLFSPAIRY